MSLTSVNFTRLEKAAVDNGFDLDRGRDGDDWLVFGSSHVSLQIWLAAVGEAQFAVAFSRSDVSDALAGMGHALPDPIPEGPVAALAANDLQELYRLVRRAFQFARSLPDEPLRAFLEKTAKLPRSTEAERLVVQRVGQDIFRDRLMDYWEGCCAITGLEVPELLRASHIKPWADCPTDSERLDVFNGILLAPHLDAAFDRGFISLADDGAVIVSPGLNIPARKILGLTASLRIQRLSVGHLKYLLWHRKYVFQR
jgi:hypothetical protein